MRIAMNAARIGRNIVSSDLGILILLALARLALHSPTNGQSGWHRDELAILDDARYLAWRYVAYPPVTPFFLDPVSLSNPSKERKLLCGTSYHVSPS